MKTKPQTAVLTMKQMPLSERPYELLEQKGAAQLTDAQLLAVLLKNGSSGERVLDLAVRMLAEAEAGGEDPLIALTRMPSEKLRRFKGIGRVKALQFQAMAELAGRLSSRRARRHFSVREPASIAAIYMEELRHRKQEVTKAIYLNTKNEILADLNLTYGTINRSLVTPREVFVPALERGGVQIILLHNHPSGDPTPSESDVSLTKRLAACGQLLDLPILDHIIIGDGTYYSMRESGVL